jgi:hypothetical protein
MDVVIFETADAKGKTIEFRTPQCAKLTAKPRPLTWQVQQGLGLSGAVARFTGIGLATGTITLMMATAEHRQAFDDSCKRFLAAPAQGQPAKVFKARHPRLARLGIWQIHFQDEPAGEWDETKQIETVTYTWEEHRKPLPTLSSPTTAGATADGPKAKSAVNAAKKAAHEENQREKDRLGKALVGSP